MYNSRTMSIFNFWAKIIMLKSSISSKVWETVSFTLHISLSLVCIYVSVNMSHAIRFLLRFNPNTQKCIRYILMCSITTN